MSDELITFLKNHEKDRGTMATLRRGLITGQEQRAWPILARYNGVGYGYRERVVQIIAGLFAFNPKTVEKGNFGFSCRSLLKDDEKKKILQGEEGPLSRRFHHLLAATDTEIFDRIIRFAMRIKQQEISLNYKQLYEDLMKWQNQYARDRIRTEWAKAFWTATDENEEDET